MKKFTRNRKRSDQDIKKATSTVIAGERARLQVRMSVEQHRKLRNIAFIRNVTMGDIVTNLIDEYIIENKEYADI